MVFQAREFYPHLSVTDNMLSPLLLRDGTGLERLPLLELLLSWRRRQTRLDQFVVTAGVFKVAKLLARKAGQLTGYQRQRAALGRAMARDPETILMEEPM